MSMYDSAMPELRPGNTAEIVEQGHIFHVTATRETGLNTGRRRYSVECVSCKVLVHPATTGPRQSIAYHLRHPEDAWPA